jgi:hypothetical protein
MSALPTPLRAPVPFERFAATYEQKPLTAKFAKKSRKARQENNSQIFFATFAAFLRGLGGEAVFCREIVRS